MKRKRYRIIETAVLTAILFQSGMGMEVFALNKNMGPDSKNQEFFGNTGFSEDESAAWDNIFAEEYDLPDDGDPSENEEDFEAVDEDGSKESQGEADETIKEENGEIQDEIQESEGEEESVPDKSTPSELNRMENATPSSAEIMLLDIPLEDSGCSTAEDLKQQVESGEYEKILLTGDITVEEKIDIETDKNVVIDMNGNRLIIQSDGWLNVTGPVRFAGTVTEEALVEVNGFLMLKDKAEIHAEGEGAVAVLCKEYVSLKEAAIRSSGAGSRALVWESARSCALSASTIEAQGSGSIGILSNAPVELKLCRVLSQGGEAVAGTGEICLDATSASPLPDEAVVIKRKIYSAGREEENGISIVAGSSREEFFDKLPKLIKLLFYDDSDTAENWNSDFFVTWSNLPEDLSEAGEYRAICRPTQPYNSNGLPLPELWVPVHVVDPLKPHIEEIFRMGNTVAFRYLNPVMGAEKLRLLYSADEGENWQDAADMSGGTLILTENLASLDGVEINKKYLFKLVVSGGPMEGESLAVPFYYYEDDADRFEHGDRDGGDRGEQDETLPDSIPPIYSENDDSGSNEGEEDISAGGPGLNHHEDKTSESAQDSTAALPEEQGENDIAALPKEPGEEYSDNQDSARASGAGGFSVYGEATGLPPFTVVLSGRQLSDQLQANDHWVTFAEEGIKVDIPVSSLRALSLKEDDTFTVLLQKSMPDRFSIRFWVGETELADFGTDGFWVELPWKGTVQEEHAIDVILEREDGLKTRASLSEQKIRGRVYNTGEYCIQTEQKEQTGQKVRRFRYAAGLVFAGAVAVFLLARHRKKTGRTGNDREEK